MVDMAPWALSLPERFWPEFFSGATSTPYVGQPPCYSFLVRSVGWPERSTASFSSSSSCLNQKAMQTSHTTLEKIERLNIVLLGLSAGFGWLLGYGHVFSLILGGIVMQGNFWLLKKLVRHALSPASQSWAGKSRAGLWFVAKSVFFLGVLSVLLARYPVHGQSFAAGVSLLLLACVIVGLSEPKSKTACP